ncbi:hypothetical protein STEG23_030637 [Scotinomys teguina]
MARKAGQGKEEEESRARQQKEKTPVREEEKTPACDGRGHHVVEQGPGVSNVQNKRVVDHRGLSQDFREKPEGKAMNSKGLTDKSLPSISEEALDFEQYWIVKKEQIHLSGRNGEEGEEGEEEEEKEEEEKEKKEKEKKGERGERRGRGGGRVDKKQGADSKALHLTHSHIKGPD